ncbi:MAG TPA: hypothetical protein VHZ53_01400, partial [Steroidobacteraceae bacterium]|nr:hypothetical protein [Steroidobacteraceae bacterium]
TVFFYRMSTLANFAGFENPDPPAFAHIGPLWGILIVLVVPFLSAFSQRGCQWGRPPSFRYSPGS